jgi:hypothetical protein
MRLEATAYTEIVRSVGAQLQQFQVECVSEEDVGGGGS